MKLKNTIKLSFITILSIGTASCKDDSQIEKLENLETEERNAVELENDAIYNYQINKDMILYSLIRYNETEDKYYLDATEKDIEQLGITFEAHKDVQTRVQQLNDANIDRQ